MAPPVYGDLGKQARDLFAKNYRKHSSVFRVRFRPHRRSQDITTASTDPYHSYTPFICNVCLTLIDFGLIKLDVKTKTPAGVEFTVNGTSNNDTGRVNASLETKYYFRDWGFTLKEKWNTDNTLATELSVEDQLIKGSKLAFSANFAPQSGKKAGTLKSSLKADHFNANADIDFDYGGALFHGSAVLGLCIEFYVYNKHVGLWLQKNGFETYVRQFRDEHKIDGKCLLTLTEDDLRSPPLHIQVLGDIKRLGIALRALQESNAELVVCLMGRSLIGSLDLNKHSLKSHNNHMNHSNLDYLSNDDFSDEFHVNRSEGQREMKPESWKALIAMLYFFTATWITAIVMVIVHDRVPDMQTYPPLPDIFLDNIPLIPHAFNMCEICGLVLFIIWTVILVFHKHRFILLRRMFSLFGSVFFLRCVTMLITSLSVPGRHLQCKARPYGSWLERVSQAFLIWQGGGMSIQGVRTCGDYMFSGHTVVLTLLNFFITEYTPTSLYLVHTLSWVLNLFGIFFILAAHEHYSIDVFIAFYISTRLFLYYHTLANNQALYQNDRKRTRIWFPLFYFFESGVHDIVPNVFDNPFRSQHWKLNVFLKKLMPKVFDKSKQL
ncbi:unnamed protein product [Medioppia subpectinata]|uniref:SAM domain-containing protein n=1 Tax=Medioppia subpectinata TaxID=1979941 RepID=A0A7R9Q5W6_9ACAR|nr:unnamed protein product [Medioppia subpectinata]CAG2113275.1 unnamed protein product [Medioppia subpectinata]